LCNSIAETPPGVKNASMVNALFNLMQHQLRFRDNDWLLFITTRSNSAMVNPETLRAYTEKINEQIIANASLLDALIDKGLVKLEEIEDGKINCDKIGNTSHSRIFALGVGFWLINIAFSAPFPWKIDMLPAYAYHVSLRDPECDMLSLGFYLKKLNRIPSDHWGIANVANAQQEVDVDYTRSANQTKVVRRVSESSDVDVMMHKDGELYLRYLDKSAELLAAAQYDKQDYLRFADEEKQKLAKFLTENLLV
jgi:hypothetical protein